MLLSIYGEQDQVKKKEEEIMHTVYWLNVDNELEHFTLEDEDTAKEFARMIEASARTIILPGDVGT